MAIENVTHSDENVTHENVTLSRARADPKGLCHGVTRDKTTSRDVTVPRDSDSPAPEAPGHHHHAVTPAVRRDEDRKRWANDKRFAGWIAGSQS